MAFFAFAVQELTKFEPVPQRVGMNLTLLGKPEAEEAQLKAQVISEEPAKPESRDASL